MTLFFKQFFVVTIANFKYCLGYTKVNFFFITMNICSHKTLSVLRTLLFICTVAELVMWMFFLSFFWGVFVVFLYFGFNIWDAAVAYFDGVTIEQFTKFMTWRKVLSYVIQKIISDFCFDINTKRRVKPNKISSSIWFVVGNIFVCRVILQSLPIARFF